MAKKHLSKQDLTSLKAKLRAEEDRIVASFQEKKSENVVAADDTKDEIDSANENILVNTNVRFFNRELLYLKKIRKALKKFDAEEYGICEECSDEIALQRLKARPTSEMCIVCKEESERQESQNAHLRVSKSIGKKIDLVTNL